jgi:hypothetical protein
MLLWRLLPLVLSTRASQQSRFRDEETHWGPHGPGEYGDGWASSGGMDDFLCEHTRRRRKENPSEKQGPHNFNEKLQVVERV